MAKKKVDIGAISVNSDTTVGTRRYSTGDILSGASTPPSTSKEKRLPIYLRASTSSCHDACKHGGKHASDAESKRVSLSKSGSRLTLSLREESLRRTSSCLEERRERFAIKPKSTSLQKETRPAVSKLNPASKIRGTEVPENHVEIKLQSPLSTPSRSISSDQEVLPTSSSKNTQVNVIDLGDGKAKQFNKTKTLSKSHSHLQLSPKHTDGKMNTSGDKGTASFQKSAIVRKNTPLLQEATSSAKPKLVNQASLKSYITHDKAPNFKQKSSVPHETAQVNAEHGASKRISKTPAVASASSHTRREPRFHRKEKEITVNDKEILKKQEKKSLKPSASSSSLKHIGGGISNVRLRKHDHAKGATPTENQKVKKIEQDTESNEGKALGVNNDLKENFTLDSAEEKLLEVEKVLFDSATQSLTECRNSDVDSLQQTLLESENADMGLLEKKLPEVENVNLDSLEQFPNDKRSLESKYASTDLLEQKVMDPDESIDPFASLSLKPDNSKLFEQGNDGINFLDEKQLKLLEADLEMESRTQNLIKPEIADMDLPLSTLLKQKDVNHDSLEPKDTDHKLLKQETASMNFIEKETMVLEKECDSTTEMNSPSVTDLDFQAQTLLMEEDMDLVSLEQEHVIINSLEKKMTEFENDGDSSDDANLSSATDDEVEYIEDSESASSEQAELQREDELEEGEGDSELIKGGERIRKERRNTTVHPDNNNCTPHKLKFRRGRIVELQPENNGPRRLRFRRRRIDGASANGVQLERKNFQRKEITQAANDSSLGSQSIVLKHQDMQEKKDAQGLFNNVIEETASKLVETRKSKVKALVGAFETVISLQDSKPESTA